METRPNRKLDEAARAGWLYFVGEGEEIARKLGISHPSAQRLVSLALSERLITFRLDQSPPAWNWRGGWRYELQFCEVVPADPSTAGFISRRPRTRPQRVRPTVIALGTGQTLRSAVDLVPRMVHEHKLVSLVGQISMEGAGSFYDVLSPTFRS